jgi:flagellar assembly protein FliH
MSSKILRSEDGAEIAPISWRATDGSTVQQQRPRVADPANGLVPEARLQELKQEAEGRVRASYNQGMAAGEAAAGQRAQQTLDPVLRGLNGIIAELATLRQRVRAELEEDTMKLAIAIARRVLYRELATDPGAILGLISAAFAKLNARETHKLRVCPADASLPPGSAIFETARGDLDASVETQLAEIDRGLTDILRRP